jgi:DNA primase
MLGLETDRHGRRALCPFHDDHHPSLDLRDDKGRAYCGPCGESWDSIALTMSVRRISFVDAIRWLAA